MRTTSLCAVIFVIASASIFLSADILAEPKTNAGESTIAVTTDTPANPLAGTIWQLVEFQSMDDTVGIQRPKDAARYTMRLNADSTVNMQLNCNRAMGTWKIEPSTNGSSGRFKFGPLATTRALCLPPSMDESIARQSAYIRGYLLKDGRLYLSLLADGGIYAWEPLTDKLAAVNIHAAPEQGGPLNWEVAISSGVLILREQPSTRSTVITSFSPGTILDNLGCKQHADRIWCDVQTFGGGPRGYVAAKYLKPARSPNGAVIYGPDKSALRASQGQFDARGKIPCAQHRDQAITRCDFGVARTGGGYATLVITRPDGRNRALFFRMGVPISADTSQADGYPDFSASKESDLHIIRIGAERYEIPDAIILGG